MTTRWTPEENERLKAMVAEGKSAARAAAAFNRTTLSVRAQARKLGVIFPTVREDRKKRIEATRTVGGPL